MYSKSPFLSFFAIITIVFTFFDHVLSTRTIQYCRHRGQNGNAEICLALNTFYNSTTDASDYYMTLQTFRYKSSKKGWVAMGLGNRMKGALMFIMYGNPEAENGALTVTVRSATGHSPVGLITDETYYKGPIPEYEIRNAKFEPYTGAYISDQLGFAPSHTGTANIVCYNCAVWAGSSIDNSTISSESASMIWATNWLQEFDDYSYDHNLEAHKFGLGFGPLWVDMLNAAITADKPRFPAIDQRYIYGTRDKGVVETGFPIPAPTEDELDSEIVTVPAPVDESKPAEPATPESEASTSSTSSTSNTPESDSSATSPEQPARTVLGKTIRDWMWHLHGACMCLAFMILYPLGATLIRTSDSRAFNFHWTTQAFASLMVLIGGIVGYWQSSSISVNHQFLGIAIILAIGCQILLGWRHHVNYLKVQRKTNMIRAHVWLGRSVFIAGFVNIIMGLLLRRYTQSVIFLSCAAMLIEIVSMLYVLGRGEIVKLSAPLSRRRDVDFRRGQERMMSGREAEEYFQLVGDEDAEDQLSEDGGDERDMAAEEGKRDQARRLAKLDKV